MSVEERNELGLEVLLFVVLGLIVYVIDSSLHFANTDRKCSVTFLPLEQLVLDEKSPYLKRTCKFNLMKYFPFSS